MLQYNISSVVFKNFYKTGVAQSTKEVNKNGI